MLRNIKIRTKLIVTPVVFFTIVGVAGFFGYQTSKNLLVSQIEFSFANDTREVMNTIDTVMHHHYRNIQAFAKGGALIKGTSTPEEITAYLQRKKEEYDYESLSYFDMNRIRIADTDGIGLGEQHPLEGFWQEVLQGKVSAGSDVRMGPSRNIPIIYFAAPVLSAESEPIGVVVARYDPHEIGNTITAAAVVAENLEAHATLFDQDRNIIYSNDPYYKDKILEEKVAELPSVKDVLRGNEGSVHEYHRHHNFEAITGYAHEKGYEDFAGNNWSLILSVNRDKALAPLVKFGRISLGMALLAAFLATVIIFILSRVISKPINNLSQTAKDIAAGDLSQRAEVKSRDEIGQLAESFNQMTEGLITRSEFTKKVIETLSHPLFILAPDGTIKSANQTACDLLGYKEEELVGKTIEDAGGGTSRT